MQSKWLNKENLLLSTLANTLDALERNLHQRILCPDLSQVTAVKDAREVLCDCGIITQEQVKSPDPIQVKW